MFNLAGKVKALEKERDFYKNLVMSPDANHRAYNEMQIPGDYRCQVCGVIGVKLWRYYQTMKLELFCVECAHKEQDKEMKIKNGFLEGCDQVGWLVPAVPTFDPLQSYWGYTSVPNVGVLWWARLPLFHDDRHNIEPAPTGED